MAHFQSKLWEKIISVKDVNVQLGVDVFGVGRRVINQLTQLDYIHLLSVGKMVECQM